MRTLALLAILALPSAALAQRDARLDLPPSAHTGLAADDTSTAPNFTPGTKGLSFGLPSGGGTELGFDYFVTPSGALRLGIGLDFQFNNGSNYDFGFDVGYRAYLGRYGRLLPFVQPQFVFSRAKSAEALEVGGSIGAEFFLLDRFTISAQTGLFFGIGNIGGTGDAIVRLFTNTSLLSANFYW